mmetsp:Transcript_4507/g.15837  ORF Transcript_4507/g.15837 Transcript_4507/m.15837 type:complete len:1205 (+) Transcript_4507:220-3834(+)
MSRLNIGLLNKFRQKVSADKNRYQQGDYDLDLTYITDRIVAMAFPADGVEAAYRNHIDKVALLLRENHGNHYVLYNLSNRPYEESKFNGEVINWCGFPDHHPPPLWLLFKIVHHIHAWLEKDPNNVAVIHCLAGKGRTGTVIASFFLFCGLVPSLDDGLNFFAYRRSMNNWGVTGPSQLRYTSYFESILMREQMPQIEARRLLKITMNGVPEYRISGGEKGCTPFFELYQLENEKTLIYSNESENLPSIMAGGQAQQHTFNVSCSLQGDILVQFRHVPPIYGGAEPMFHLAFNVGMINGDTLIITKFGLEKAEKDTRYPNDFSVTLTFDPHSEVELQLSDEEANRRLQLFTRKPELENQGKICFFGDEDRKTGKVSIARDIGSPVRGTIAVKGGWLHKRGHKIKNWKRRWFALRGSTLSYFKNPRDLKSVGVIAVTLIQRVSYLDHPVDTWPFCFEIITYKNQYIISAPGAKEMRAWTEAIIYARNLHLHNNATARSGLLSIKVMETTTLRHRGNLCCTIGVEDQRETAAALEAKGSPLADSIPIFNASFTFDISELDSEVTVLIWEQLPAPGEETASGSDSDGAEKESQSRSPGESGSENERERGGGSGEFTPVKRKKRTRDVFLGEVRVPISQLILEQVTDKWYGLQMSTDYAGAPEVSIHLCTRYESGTMDENDSKAELQFLKGRPGSRRAVESPTHFEGGNQPVPGWYKRGGVAVAASEESQRQFSLSDSHLKSVAAAAVGSDHLRPPNVPSLSHDGTPVTESQLSSVSHSASDDSVSPALAPVGQSPGGGGGWVTSGPPSGSPSEPAPPPPSISIGDERQTESTGVSPSPSPSQQRARVGFGSDVRENDSESGEGKGMGLGNRSKSVSHLVKEKLSDTSAAPEVSLSLAVLRRLESGARDIRHLVVVGTTLWAGDSAGAIHVWDVVRFALLDCIKIHNGPVTAMAVVAQRFIWSCSGEDILVLDARTRKVHKRLRRQQQRICAMIYVNAGDGHVWTGSSDLGGSRGTICIWSAKTMECKKKFEIGNSAIGCFCFSGGCVWVGTFDFILAFDCMSFQHKFQLKIGLGMIENVIAYNEQIWTCSKESARICVWNHRTGELVETLRAHGDKVLLMQQVAGRHVWTTAADKVIVVWDLATRKALHILTGPHTELVTQVAQVGPDVVCTSALDHTLCFWRFSLPAEDAAGKRARGASELPSLLA